MMSAFMLYYDYEYRYLVLVPFFKVLIFMVFNSKVISLNHIIDFKIIIDLKKETLIVGLGFCLLT